MNENNFNKEDCIIITRTFLNKSKKILALSKDYEENKNIDLTISMWSTLIVDCILLDMPVIEFFIYKDNTNRWFKNDGKAISGYSKYNLLRTVHNASDLEKYLLMSNDELSKHSRESKESLKKILDMSYIRNIREKLLSL